MKKICVVCGPTASGKTGLSVRLAKAVGGEVISADCMLVYKGLNIGSAKPTLEERQGVVHHMIDVAQPTQKYSVGDYEEQALPILENLVARETPAVICGGTGFYIQSLCFSRGHGNTCGDEQIREKYNRMAEEQGNESVYSVLQKIDPESARTLHPNDLKRVIRAIEIYELTGKKKSEQNDGFRARHPYVAVALDWPREELYERINLRVDTMLADGQIEEVRSLLKNGVDETCQSMQGIGYKEVIEYLKNEITYDEMRDKICQNTRRYAKRQLTFFRKFPELMWMDPHDTQTEQKILEALNG